MSDQKRIPQHVAIIMDGNGRWAELRGKERYEGHARVSNPCGRRCAPRRAGA